MVPKDAVFRTIVDPIFCTKFAFGAPFWVQNSAENALCGKHCDPKWCPKIEFWAPFGAPNGALSYAPAVALRTHALNDAGAPVMPFNAVQNPPAQNALKEVGAPRAPSGPSGGAPGVHRVLCMPCHAIGHTSPISK